MPFFIVTLNRPKALNALSSPLFKEINDALSKYDESKDIGAIVITGSEKAFAGKSQTPKYLPINIYTLTSVKPAPTLRKWPP